MKNHGFTLIELVIAIGLAAVFIPAIVYVFSFSLGSASQGEKYSQAYAIAQEQMEAVYYLKKNSLDWVWENSSFNTGVGEYYQLENSVSGWKLKAKSTTTQSVNGYTALIEIYPVNRDADGIISEGAGSTLDPYTRKIVVTVLWEDESIPPLVSYVTNH